MLWVKSIIFILYMNVTPLSFASDAPAASSGEHGSSGAVVDADYSGKQTQAWSDVQTKLAALKAKVDAQEAIVKNLVMAKQHGSSEGMSAKIEQLKIEDQKLQKLNAEYQKMNIEFETKFPEKGIKEARKYIRIDPKNEEHIESNMTLDGRITHIQNKILKQYPKSAQKLKTEKDEKLKQEELKRIKLKKSLPKKTENQNIKEKKSDDITEQIILNK